ncbi:pilus (MSHA type) biogenesis protein MshL [Pseudoduganella sp. SL102]|uniref:pilus (MSHA type) biogenesis protein MshL n=1 Tax=Pseudoduganella sp. SL102 TaxID=2995154 RepID=UPI00248B3C0E|nr:pilus (MSHA type) biogenesis protein MshL [Pseudoduganella sp. SL102]WBR99833.1 pilus (MSHA type) biogenesis protein MshL [Pseudoduganella sp. SL102]
MRTEQTMRTLAAMTCVAMLAAGCDSANRRDTYDTISGEMRNATAKSAQRQHVAPDAVEAALLPPAPALAATLPKARAVLDERFNVALNNVPAQQFFTSIATGTRYNMLVSPEVTGTLSANLKDVTIFEALDAVRELYGYDWKVEGNRIYIRPLTMQTRMFKVNYLTGSRRGVSNVRVSSTSINSVPTRGEEGQDGGQQNASQSQSQTQNGSPSGTTSVQDDASNVKMTSETDFWGDLKAALEAIVGTGDDGRNVIISPQSGVVLVRALPAQLRSVDEYLKATRLAVERQVILEAKILEVQLNNGFQTGVNWAAFRQGGNSAGGIGVIAPGTNLVQRNPLTGAVGQQSGGDTGFASTPGVSLGSAADALGTMFGLAIQTSNFSAMLSFLESQGTVHVLSSPRIATLNNQKAVLKIGTDEFYVTGISTTTSSNVGGNTVTPNVIVKPFFSGVLLDVTPQIDDDGHIMLHVHPSVSSVTTINKTVSLGSAGSLNLPLAASSTSEMDSMVRGRNGEIVAIGGLMRQATSSDQSQLPGVGNVPVLGALFRNKDSVSQKRELVVLIKPTIVDDAGSMAPEMQETMRRIERLDPQRGR